MGGVTGKKDTSVHEAVGDGALAHPQSLVLDRIRHIAAHAAADEGRDIHALEMIGVQVDELQPPQILAIDDRQERPGPSGPTKT